MFPYVSSFHLCATMHIHDHFRSILCFVSSINDSLKVAFCAPGFGHVLGESSIFLKYIYFSNSNFPIHVT